MHQPPHPRGLAGPRQALRQLHVHAPEVVGAAVQDGHQVDHRVHAHQQLRQLGVVVHVGPHDLHGREGAHAIGMLLPPCWHAHQARAGLAFDEAFTHRATDEAGATEDEYFVHGSGASGNVTFDGQCTRSARTDRRAQANREAGWGAGGGRAGGGC